MFKKFVIPGLVLLLAGAAVLGWVLVEKNKEQKQALYLKSKYGSEPDGYLKQYTEWLQLPPEQRTYLPWGLDQNGQPKSEEQLRQEQQERLKADLDKLAAGNKDTYPFADVLYGADWQEELRKYEKQRAKRENIYIGSILGMFTGGGILTCGLLIWIGRILFNTSSTFRKVVAWFYENESTEKDQKPAQANPQAELAFNNPYRGYLRPESKSGFGTGVVMKPDFKAEKLTQSREEAKIKPQVKVKDNAQTKAGAETKTKAEAKKSVRVSSKAAKDQTGQKEKEQSKPRKLSQVLPNSGFQSSKANSANKTVQAKSKTDLKSKTGGNSSTKNIGKKAASPSDKESAELVKSLESAAENMKASRKVGDSLKSKTENLEKQMAELRQKAKGVNQPGLEHSKPINNTLNELTEQVSAIREYAASQQDRLKKLQDGYDWNIMRTFCLRFIRCIDNLDRRISELADKNVEVLDLEEVRDELLFALESSGVEPYEPKVNSDYHGQEKYAEAVKEKESCDDPKRSGKIAKVIRPAYQYFIDDENAKIVRPAQVKLFG
jgi:hypothetical protein